MKLVCISDTHSMHRRIPEIPEGDVLIHSGDCLGAGTLDNLEDLNDWLGTLPHRHKIIIAGNRGAKVLGLALDTHLHGLGVYARPR